jgi:hypothetical protein
VISTPAVASTSEGFQPTRIDAVVVLSPPSKRITASASVPIPCESA